MYNIIILKISLLGYHIQIFLSALYAGNIRKSQMLASSPAKKSRVRLLPLNILKQK